MIKGAEKLQQGSKGFDYASSKGRWWQLSRGALYIIIIISLSFMSDSCCVNFYHLSVIGLDLEQDVYHQCWLRIQDVVEHG